MTKVFVKSSELELVNGGYLSTNGKPVGNAEFVKAQKEAERIITIVALSKGKDFKGKTPDSLDAVIQEADRLLTSKKQVQYISTPDKPERPINESLKKEALAWMNHQDNVQASNALNQFMAQFDVIHEFEEFGLFFDEEIVKLNKIYTIAEITESVKAYFSLLD